MQEKTTVNAVSSLYKQFVRMLAWLLLFSSWLCLVSATKSFVTAVQEYGVLNSKTYLDAGFGYYGLFSFGLAAAGVLAAIKGNMKTNGVLFRFFKITFFASICFLAPTLFAMLTFLFSH